MDVATLAQLLRETAEHHDRFEKAAPAHDWWDWYAPYLSAREQGRSPEQADAAADLYMKEERGVPVFPMRSPASRRRPYHSDT